MTDKDMAEVDAIVKKMRDGANPSELLETAAQPKVFADVGGNESASGRHLVVAYSDFEPDDTFGIAQLWQWKRERDEIRGQPLLIFHIDFANKEKGTIFEKKDLITKLMLSQASTHMLLSGNDEQVAAGKEDETHPRYDEIWNARATNMRRIAEGIANFKGEVVEFYVLAPGHGNLAAILAELKTMNAWPIKASWRLFLYTGAFNMRGMFDSDMDALKQMMAYSKDPLIDMSKFPFFGAKNSHKWTASMTTFATPNFAVELANKHPLLAAALKSFNDEFNVHLIEPGSKSLFKGSTLDDEERNRFNLLKRVYDAGGPGAIENYAKALVSDQELFAKVAGFKKTTLRAYACGSCDSPLCDQLVFLYQWIKAEMPECLSDQTPGSWVFDQKKGFTSVSPTADGPFRAIQPTLKEPKDEASLIRMRTALESYVVRFVGTNAELQKLCSSVSPKPHMTDAEFQIFWSQVDPEKVVDAGAMKDLAMEIAGADGSIDMKKLLIWAVS